MYISKLNQKKSAELSNTLNNKIHFSKCMVEFDSLFFLLILKIFVQNLVEIRD